MHSFHFPLTVGAGVCGQTLIECCLFSLLRTMQVSVVVGLRGRGGGHWFIFRANIYNLPFYLTNIYFNILIFIINICIFLVLL